MASGQVVARHQEKIVAKDTVKVSNNFGAMLRQCRYPSRKGSGSIPNSSPAASNADIIPSDEEILDVETTPAAKRGGHPSGAPPANKERDFAAAAAHQKRSNNEVDDDDDKDEDDDDGDDNDDDDANDNDDDNEGRYVDITGFAAAPAAAAPDGARAWA